MKRASKKGGIIFPSSVSHRKKRTWPKNSTTQERSFGFMTFSGPCNLACLYEWIIRIRIRPKIISTPVATLITQTHDENSYNTYADTNDKDDPSRVLPGKLNGSRVYSFFIAGLQQAGSPMLGEIGRLEKLLKKLSIELTLQKGSSAWSTHPRRIQVREFLQTNRSSLIRVFRKARKPKTAEVKNDVVSNAAKECMQNMRKRKCLKQYPSRNIRSEDHHPRMSPSQACLCSVSLSVRLCRNVPCLACETKRRLKRSWVQRCFFSKWSGSKALDP